MSKSENCSKCPHPALMLTERRWRVYFMHSSCSILHLLWSIRFKSDEFGGQLRCNEFRCLCPVWWATFLVAPLGDNSFPVIVDISFILVPKMDCDTASISTSCVGDPPPVTLTFDLLTLKVVSESRVTWATSVPIVVFLGLSVLNLGSMYATDSRQTHIIA